MPVVIQEMTVQVEVNQGENVLGSGEPGQSVYGPNGNPQFQLVSQCIEEVMEVLRHQNER